MSAFSLAKKILGSPGEGAVAARDAKSLRPSLYIYLAFLVSYLVFFRLKPFDFPDRNAPLPREPQDLLFWTKVTLWQPLLEGAWIAILLGLTRFFASGTWSVRFALGLLWTAFPFLGIILYTTQQIPKAGLFAFLLVWAGLFALPLRSATKQDWRGLASFMLAVNAIGIVLLIPMGLTILMGTPELFTVSQAAGGLWILGWATKGVRELTGLRLPRAFMAVLFSMFFQIWFAFTLHLLGIVPKDILKALFYA